MISECCNLARLEYKTSHDWVGKVVPRKKYKKFRFDNTNKWYMHKPASVLENDTYVLLWDSDIQTDHLISVRKPNLGNIIKKERTC